MSSNMTKFKQSAYKGVIKKKLRLQDEVWTDMADVPIKRKKNRFSLLPYHVNTQWKKSSLESRKTYHY